MPLEKNYPGPYEVRLNYTVSASSVVLSHQQRLNVRISGTPTPGEIFPNIDALRRDDTPVALDEEVDDWVALLQPLFSNLTTFVNAELWKYEALSFESSFVGVYTIGLAGTSGTAQPAGQAIMTFRTNEGGIMKISLMECNIAPAVSVTYPNLSVAGKALADAVQFGTSPWLARDTSYPFAFIALHPGQNEVLFKKRFRANL
jgi:hypothetical protein